METKTECIQNLRRKGFTEDFTPGNAYDILLDFEKTYKPHEIKISAFYQCIQENKDEDNLVLFAIETSDGKKGILMDNTRSGDKDTISVFIHAVVQARIKNKRSWLSHPMKKLFKSAFSAN